MKTKKRIQKRMEELKDFMKINKQCYENNQITEEEYTSLYHKLESQQLALNWVISTEWEKDDIEIEECIDICHNNEPYQKKWSDTSPNAMHFQFSLSIWFDVNEKFNLNIQPDDSTWVNLFVFYDPFADELFVEYSIDEPSKTTFYNYIPTNLEKLLIVTMIEDWCEYNENMSSKNVILDILKHEKEELNEVSDC